MDHTGSMILCITDLIITMTTLSTRSQIDLMSILRTTSLMQHGA